MNLQAIEPNPRGMGNLGFSARKNLRIKTIVHFVSVSVLLLWMTFPALGQEIYLLGGLGANPKSGEPPFTYQLSYSEGLSDHFEWSLSLLNEGHIKDHKRDGVTPQFWFRSDFQEKRFSLAAGAGPYLYFDTEPSADRDYKNKHGFGEIFSLNATLYTAGPWLFQLRANRVWTDGDVDMNSFLLGIGYRLGPLPSRDPIQITTPTTSQSPKNEITAFVGTPILNSLESESSLAGGLEYRRHSIAHDLDWTMGWMTEGSPGSIDRQGITTQIWPTRSFFDKCFCLGVGLGVYLASDRHAEEFGEDENNQLAGLLSLTASYRLGRNIVMRLTWHRTITDYNRDTDVLFVGMGYVF